MKISFDFDQTLSELEMQTLAKEFLKLGAEVHITTSRPDYIHGVKVENDDLFEIANQIGIDKKNIKFTCYDDKYKFVKDFDLHFDDSEEEINLINSFPGKCIGVHYNPKPTNLSVNF